MEHRSTNPPIRDIKIMKVFIQSLLSIKVRTKTFLQLGDRQKAQMETEKMAARVGESFKTTKVGVMSPKKEKGSDEETSSDEDYND